MAILLFLRDATLITLYMVKKFIDNAAEPAIRPQGEGKYMSRVEMDASVNITSFLADQRDEAIDIQGNTALHVVIGDSEKTNDDIEQLVNASPHLMYMVNREGCSPLDQAIN